MSMRRLKYEQGSSDKGSLNACGGISMKVIGFSHITINVSNLQRSLELELHTSTLSERMKVWV